jgi:hypothetical protein
MARTSDFRMAHIFNPAHIRDMPSRKPALLAARFGA